MITQCLSLKNFKPIPEAPDGCSCYVTQQDLDGSMIELAVLIPTVLVTRANTKPYLLVGVDQRGVISSLSFASQQANGGALCNQWPDVMPDIFLAPTDMDLSFSDLSRIDPICKAACALVFGEPSFAWQDEFRPPGKVVMGKDALCL